MLCSNIELEVVPCQNLLTNRHVIKLGGSVSDKMYSNISYKLFDISTLFHEVYFIIISINNADQKELIIFILFHRIFHTNGKQNSIKASLG